MISLGTVFTPPTVNGLSPTGAHHVQVLLQPGGRLCEARIAHIGGLPLGGILAAYAPGAEVVVVFPGGSQEHAVVIGALHNGVSPAPATWTPASALTGLLVQCPTGVEIRSVDALPAEGMLLSGTFLAALQTYTQALSVFMSATAAATTAPQIAAAATAFQVASAAFLASLATSISVPTGVLPFASPLNRVTA